MKPAQLAINAISTSREAPLPETLAAYAAAGFAHVEFNIARLRAFLHQGHSVADIARLLHDSGLGCIGGFETALNPFAHSASDRAARSDRHRQNAELLASLTRSDSRVTMVVGVEGPASGSAGGLDALTRTAETARDLVETFPPNVALAIEFNWGPVVRSIKAAHHTVRLAGHPRIGILFDPAHYHCTACKLADLTPAVCATILHVHVNDMPDKPQDYSHCNDDRVLPGQGHLDLPEIFSTLESNGYTGLFSIEMFSQELWQMPPAKAAQRMYAAMAALCT